MVIRGLRSGEFDGDCLSSASEIFIQYPGTITKFSTGEFDGDFDKFENFYFRNGNIKSNVTLLSGLKKLSSSHSTP